MASVESGRVRGDAGIKGLGLAFLLTLVQDVSAARCPINYPAQMQAPEGPLVRAMYESHYRAMVARPPPGEDRRSPAIAPDEDTAHAIARSTTALARDDCAAPYVAAMFGFEQVLVRLIDLRVDLYAADGWLGMTPLLAAAYAGQLATVRVLIERKAARVNESAPFRIDFVGGHGPSIPRPSGGETALFWAARQGHVDVVRYLLERGASASARTYDGATALDMAKLMRRDSIADMLRENGARD